MALRALRCGNLFATQQRPSAFWKAGIWTGPVNLGSCLKIFSSQLSGGSHTGELAMSWRVLGIFLSAQSDAGALTSLYRHWFTGIYGFFLAILISSEE